MSAYDWFVVGGLAVFGVWCLWRGLLGWMERRQ